MCVQWGVQPHATHPPINPTNVNNVPREEKEERIGVGTGMGGVGEGKGKGGGGV